MLKTYSFFILPYAHFSDIMVGWLEFWSTNPTWNICGKQLQIACTGFLHYTAKTHNA